MKIRRRYIRNILTKLLNESKFPTMDQLGVGILSQGQNINISSGDDVLEHLSQGLSQDYASLPVFELARVENDTNIQALYSSISRGQSDGDA